MLSNVINVSHKHFSSISSMSVKNKRISLVVTIIVDYMWKFEILWCHRDKQHWDSRGWFTMSLKWEHAVNVCNAIILKCNCILNYSKNHVIHLSTRSGICLNYKWKIPAAVTAANYHQPVQPGAVTQFSLLCETETRGDGDVFKKEQEK